ncbi:hypothetical protein ACFW0H_01045 [Pseudomonas sp. CR3202]|uniref:hypothetical protein n=1 Tax=Pseudomonas sp. CR3202 TaxID=3351532 RepID=UPI003BF08A7F
MTEPTHWAKLRQLSLDVAASHAAMVAFLEEGIVPWSDDQMARFEQLVLAERVALSAYAALAADAGGYPVASETRPVNKADRPLAVPATIAFMDRSPHRSRSSFRR